MSVYPIPDAALAHHTILLGKTRAGDYFQAKAGRLDDCITAAARALGYRDIEEIGRELDDKRFTEGLKPARVSAAPTPQRRAVPAALLAARQPAPARGVRQGEGEGTIKLPPGERAVLIAAVQYGGVDRDQLSVLTGYKRSSRDAYIARLRDKGLVQVSGQTVSPTDAAVAALGTDYEPLPEGIALQDYWTQRLPPGEAAILGVLIESYPDLISRGDLDDRTGYKRSSRDAYIQRLKARRLVEVSGPHVAASATLF